jgi:hypothetical protein
MSPNRSVSRLAVLAAAALVAVGLSACGSDGGGAAPEPTPITNPALPPTVPPNPDNGGGGSGGDNGGGGGGDNNGGGGSAQAGAPVFQSFQVTSPVACVDGNAEVTMSYATLNVVSIEIKIGDGSFAGTAGYGPNESGVVASIPCSGAGQSSIELKGCTESLDCANSSKETVEITG